MTDLAVSARCYARPLRPGARNEFFEDGAVRGVVLADHEGGFVIGLRKREYCARSPVLDGFDVCASMLRTAEEMFVVRDPDGTVLRFVAGPPTGRARRITEWIEL